MFSAASFAAPLALRRIIPTLEAQGSTEGDPMATTLKQHALDIGERTSVELAAGSSVAEALTSVAAVVLTIAGIAGTFPAYAASLATIALGVGLVFEGGAVGARFVRTLNRREGDSLTTGDVAGGITAELFAGLSGIGLGVMALFGVAPLALLPTAALVFGAGLLIGCAALSHSSVAVGEEGDPNAIASSRRDAMLAAAGGQLFVGFAASVLGVLALLGIGTLTLTLVALLAIAASELLSGAALGARMLRRLRR
jgi:hypothetical protein